MEIGQIYKFYGGFENLETLVGVFEGTDKTTGFLMFKDVCLAKYCDNSRPTIDHIRCYLNDKAPEDVIYSGKDAEKIIDEWKKTNIAPESCVKRRRVAYNPNDMRLFIPMKTYFEEA